MKKILLPILFLFFSFNVFASGYSWPTYVTPIMMSDLPLGKSLNCGITVSASGTMTIGDADNSTALSSSNVCKIGVSSDSTGAVDVYSVTSNITLTFGGTSDTDNNSFGITETVNWASATPLFLGVVDSGTNDRFVVSRIPISQTGSVVGSLCNQGGTSCDETGDAMVLSATDDLSLYVSKPVTPVGWFQGTFVATGAAYQAWTFSMHKNSGFNDAYFDTWFTFVVNQMGAHANVYLATAGGDGTNDIPRWVTDQGTYYYKWKNRSTFHVSYTTVDSGNCSNGDTGGTPYVALPYPVENDNKNSFRVAGQLTLNNTARVLCPRITNANIALAELYDCVGGGFVANNFANANDDISMNADFNVKVND